METEIWAIKFLTAGYEIDWGFGQSDLVKNVPARGMGWSLKDPSNSNFSVILWDVTYIVYLLRSCARDGLLHIFKRDLLF